ncbi:MAG TPA: potassium-transporting ATPase subunit KdpC [Kofleriaceae bacterium]|nr:potassium-transporting ATPase subunit KdpC [Kofleriaceae bacterium]
MKDAIRPAIVSLLVFTVLCGVVYPLVMDGLAALAFPHQARGSLIRDPSGQVVGSELIGQPFDEPTYFWSRPTAQANYDASSSTGTNQGMSGFVDAEGRLGANPALARAVAERIAALRAADPGNPAPIPVDLVTASASGLDPDISPAAAYYQVRRVARARGRSEAEIRALVAAHVVGRTFGVLGEPRVNVLGLDRALDAADVR